jgi:pyruvate dehydrogenase (quinone)
MAKRTVADQFVEILLAAGVRRMYGVVGDSLNPVVDAIRRHDDIDWMHVRNTGSFPRGRHDDRKSLEMSSSSRGVGQPGW